MSPLDLCRLAVRIEWLQMTSTTGWSGGDAQEFRNILPGGRDPRALPDPKMLRVMADRRENPLLRTWRLWVAMAMHLESLVHANDPRNINRIVRDMMHGKHPFVR